jgi:hypothetical protein
MSLYTHLVLLLLALARLCDAQQDCLGNQLAGDATKLSADNCDKFLPKTIPSGIGKYTDLTLINLFNTTMVGTIPTQIGLLTKLTVL